MYDFGLRIQKLRKQKQLSQTQAARRLNIHPATVSAYERNIKIPSASIIADLALLYSTTTDHILGLDNRQVFCVDGLTDRQKEIIDSLLLEFRNQ